MARTERESTPPDMPTAPPRVVRGHGERESAVPWAWPAAFLVALLLAAVMATVSRVDAHPDEIWHMRAAEYYVTHWLPPAVGDPATVGSYSQYGMSYLNERDIVYFLAGKFARLLQMFDTPFTLSCRLFNLLQLVVLGAVFILRRDSRYSIGLLLLSPQLWYIYSYFNGDAFPLSVGMMMAVVWSGTPRRGDVSSHASSAFWRIAIIAAGMIILSLSKKNYFSLVAFFAAVAGFRTLGREGGVSLLVAAGLLGLRDFPSVGEFARRAALVGSVISLALGAIWLTYRSRSGRAPHGWTAWAAGLALVIAATGVAPSALERLRPAPIAAKSLGDMVGETSVGAYKPAATGGIQLPGIGLRAKGLPFYGILFAPWYWPIVMAASVSGFYGYMNIRAPWAFYGLLWIDYAVLLTIGLQAIRRIGERSVYDLVWVIVLCASGLVGASAYHSWVNDFQAQGRYLFPLVPMIAAILPEFAPALDRTTTARAAVVAFALSVVSFAAVGLFHIPK